MGYAVMDTSRSAAAIMRATAPVSMSAGQPVEARDVEVIEAVLRGEADRYAELVIRYQTAAWTLAYRFVGNWEDAKELSQNGFIKAYQHLRRFRRRAAFSTWLYRIIVNECKDFFKRKARRPAMVSLGSDPADDDPVLFEAADPSGDPGTALADRELAKQMSTAIEGLPMKQHEAFVLHHLQGLSLEEAARVMRCRVGTVKAHLFRACEQLRSRLTPYLSGEARS